MADPTPSQPIAGNLTPEQIQAAIDQWSDVQAAQDKATADQSRANANQGAQNWVAVAEDWATAARLLERWYGDIATPASALPSPDNGKDPNWKDPSSP